MKLTTRAFYGIAAGLLLVMAVLMFLAAQRDSATVDETTALSTGYSYWQGHRFYFVPEHPPVGQMWTAIPLLFMNVKLSANAQGVFDGRISYPWTRPWEGPVLSMQGFIPPGCGGGYVDLQQPPFHRLIGWNCTGSYPLQNWYLWALPESQIFGQMLIYDGANDGSAMLLAGRCMQILLTVIVGLFILIWIRRTTENQWAALAGLACWVFNPTVLAHGHLTTTDMGAAFGVLIATFTFSLMLEKPSLKSAMIWGGAMGLALVMKLTAVILVPVFLLLLIMRWQKLKTGPLPVWKLVGSAVLTSWAVIMIVYFPHWSPAPSISESQAQSLGIPGWFTAFRPLLIPPDFFKALGLTLGHSKEGHEAYLMGQWSHTGWWYYYPLAFFLKTPLAFVISGLAACGLFLRRFKTARPLELVPWVTIVIYLFSAMTSHVNIGVRHLLPIFPMLCVGIGAAAARLSNQKARLGLGLLVGWQAVVTLTAFPLYVQFFSEAVGGAKNGQLYLEDSNYDWGQDANRLKAYLDEHHIDHIYLDYFGTQYNIEYLKIPNTRIDAQQARQIKNGWLVVSTSELLRPDWAWLRDSKPPVTRIAQTLYLYEFR